jgi:hypothetical protein
MFNIKWGGIAAGTAFALALILSLLLGQTNLPIALLRAVVFAALFFGLGIGIWALIKTFLPELLSAETADIATHLFSTGQTGSRVNITVDDTHNAALPEQHNEGDVGDFNDLFSAKGDIDQTSATSYTEEGETGGFAAAGEPGSTEGFAPAGEFASTDEFASTFGDDGLNEAGEGEDEEDSGDFSMDFSAFVPGGLNDEDGDEVKESDDEVDPFSFFPGGTGSATFEEPAPEERKVSRNKPMKLEGDFNAKEIAAGLRTVLEKDKK